jgi:hypothetical protein
MLAPFVAMAAVPMRLARRAHLDKRPLTRSVFKSMGVFPLRDHYYEPQFDFESVGKPAAPRRLPGIDFNLDSQRNLLAQFNGKAVPERLDQPPKSDTDFSFQNPNFGGGDADIWFQMIRHFKPSRIFEIGSGHSTKMARLAVSYNQKDDPAYECQHMCIEPFEMPWLEKLGIEVRRELVENIDPDLFNDLAANDILFIDSSHMIRPGGDVLTEYLEILPTLAPGVVVHIHDIFTPREYPESWLREPRFWNEQYLLEGFLTHNSDWEVLLANNDMANSEPELMTSACRYFRAGQHQPGSFYLRRIR